MRMQPSANIASKSKTVTNFACTAFRNFTNSSLVKLEYLSKYPLPSVVITPKTVVLEWEPVYV